MIEGAAQAVAGNEAVIDLLKHWTSEAEKGELAFVALALSYSPTCVTTAKAGVIGHEFAISYGLDLLKDSIKAQVSDKMPEHPDPSLDTSYRLYNIAKMPCSFDFLAGLVDAEMTRVREGAPPPLKIGFFFGKGGNETAALNTDQRKQNFSGIVQPLVNLICAVEDKAAAKGRPIEQVSLIPVVKAYLKGEKIPKFTVPEDVTDSLRDTLLKEFGQIPVTITLREAAHIPHRNSNLTEWLKFAEWLETHGEKVLFVRDTVKATEPITGFRTFPPASQDMHARTALYAVAKANMFVTNGPAMIAVFGDKPWLIFDEYNPQAIHFASTAEGWRHCAGIEPKEQWPWSRPDQRIIWKPDKFEIMRDAWIEFIEPKLKEAA